jgi:DNA polymerase-1
MDALIDADSLLYKVGFAIEDKVVWNQAEIESGEEEIPQVDYFTDLEQCYNTFDQLLDTIMYVTDCDDVLLVFTGHSNFRMDLPTPYKENRKDSRKPTGYQEILDYALKNYPNLVVDYMEADDYVVWRKAKEPEDWVLCAIDKDVIYQSEGTHYNYGRGEEVTVTADEAVYYAYYQTLTGDVTDGYKGCKGIGPKKADKILGDCKTEYEMWQAVVDTYINKGQTEDEALWTMRLANMHQYNGTTIKYWNPPAAPV